MFLSMRGREGRKRDDLHLVIKFLQNMEETFLSSKIPMNHSFNPKGTYKIFFSFGFNSSIFAPTISFFVPEEALVVSRIFKM
jgi:hypothetical protein